MSDNIIVLPREDVAALMAAVADLEQGIEGYGNLVLSTVFGERTTVSKLFEEATIVLSRIASDIDQQVSTQ